MNPAMSACAQCSISRPFAMRCTAIPLISTGPARRLVPDALAKKRPTRGHASHHLVAFGDDVVDDVHGIGECSLQDADVLTHPLPTRRQVGQRRVVVHVVLGNEVFHNVEVAAIQFGEPAHNDRFTLLAGQCPLPTNRNVRRSIETGQGRGRATPNRHVR